MRKIQVFVVVVAAVVFAVSFIPNGAKWYYVPSMLGLAGLLYPRHLTAVTAFAIMAAFLLVITHGVSNRIADVLQGLATVVSAVLFIVGIIHRARTQSRRSSPDQQAGTTTR